MFPSAKSVAVNSRLMTSSLSYYITQVPHGLCRQGFLSKRVRSYCLTEHVTYTVVIVQYSIGSLAGTTASELWVDDGWHDSPHHSLLLS